MDAREYFNYVVVPRYNEFVQSPNDFRLLENTLYSMDTVAERLGLHQLGYAQVSREALYRKAKEILVNLAVSETYTFAATRSNMDGLLRTTAVASSRQ